MYTKDEDMTPPLIVEGIESWKLGRLSAYSGNARTHSREQIAQIVASISEFGFVNPILVGSDGVIIAGHARLLAAKKLGMTAIPVIVLGHLSEQQRRALIIADNQLALNASWDEGLLHRELAALQQDDFPVDLLGFEEKELSQLLAIEEDIGGCTDEDAIPVVGQEPVTVSGDLWILGDHKLLCGDGLLGNHLETLMAGELADLIFTDPPWNVNYQGYTERRLKISGDSMTAEQFRHFLGAAFTSCRRVMKPSASIYICHSSCWQREFQDALEGSGFTVRCQIIWAKNTFAWGFGRYKFQHEPIFYGHVAGAKDRWYGDKSQSTLWEENKPAANRDHPTSKPVALVERAIWNSSGAGDVIVDLFGGSGSTLIACHRRARKCRLMEIDPLYADVIVRRWEAYTGQSAALSSDGRSFKEVAEQRGQKKSDGPAQDKGVARGRK
jgi:DNA modification methylase